MERRGIRGPRLARSAPALVLWCSGVLACSLAAQIPSGQTPLTPQGPGVVRPGWPVGGAPLPRWPGDPPVYRRGFQGLQSVYPVHQTFPNYPAGRGPVRRPDPTFLERYPGAQRWQPTQLGEREQRWPSWLRGPLGPDAEEGAPRADRAILARNADRVWFLGTGEDAFVPLAFHDKFRALEDGTVVEVRNKGAFLVAFHDGALLRSVGPVRLHVSRLSEEMSELRLERFRRVWLSVKGRPCRLLLPDASRLEIRDAEVYVESAAGRGFLHNHGPESVEWRGRVGSATLPQAHRLDILLERPGAPYLASDFATAGSVRIAHKGRVVEVSAEGNGGSVDWSGTRFALGGGQTLRIDPLAGMSFPKTRKRVEPESKPAGQPVR